MAMKKVVTLPYPTTGDRRGEGEQGSVSNLRDARLVVRTLLSEGLVVMNKVLSEP